MTNSKEKNLNDILDNDEKSAESALKIKEATDIAIADKLVADKLAAAKYAADAAKELDKKKKPTVVKKQEKKLPTKIKILESKIIHGYPVCGHRGISCSRKINTGMVTENMFLIKLAVRGGIAHEVVED